MNKNEFFSPEEQKYNKQRAKEALRSKSREVLSEVLATVIDFVAEQESIIIPPEKKEAFIASTFFVFEKKDLEPIQIQLRKSSHNLGAEAFERKITSGMAVGIRDDETGEVTKGVIIIKNKKPFTLIHEMDHLIRAYLNISQEDEEEHAYRQKIREEVKKKADKSILLFALAMVCNTTTYPTVQFFKTSNFLNAVDILTPTGLDALGIFCICLISVLQVKGFWELSKSHQGYENMRYEQLADTTAKLFLGEKR